MISTLKKFLKKRKLELCTKMKIMMSERRGEKRKRNGNEGVRN